MEVERMRAENERLRLLTDFVSKPICAFGGAEPDPDIITAYNLAVEGALQAIRRMAGSVVVPTMKDKVEANG